MKCKGKKFGLPIAAFGMGILLATFLPCTWLVWILAMLVVGAGVIMFIT